MTTMALHLSKTHRQIVPFDRVTATRSVIPDAFVGIASSVSSHALLHLDATGDNSIRLPLTQTEMKASNTDQWKPGYVWHMDQIQFLMEQNNPQTHTNNQTLEAWSAISDLHNIVPQQSKLGLEDISFWYGQCSECSSSSKIKEEDNNMIFPNANEDMLCLCPATRAWQPPIKARGEIARAMLYMQLRYGASSSVINGLGLTLSDCPSNHHSWKNMGYKSHLVQWHLEYPPTEREQQRNANICHFYQGNRNPFVDFYQDSWSWIPFNAVDSEKCTDTVRKNKEATTIDVSRTTEQGVETPTTTVEDATTADRVELNKAYCDALMPGDINFNMLMDINFNMLMDTVSSSSSFGLVALVELPAGLELYVTVRTNWLDNNNHHQGTMKLVIPSGGVRPIGRAFGYGDYQYLGEQWTWTTTTTTSSDSKLFTVISDDDDTLGVELVLYCIPSTSPIKGLAAISTKGTGIKDLPVPLQPQGYGVLVLSYGNHTNSSYRYTGPLYAQYDQYAKALIDPTLWEAATNGNLSTVSGVLTDLFYLGSSSSNGGNNNKGEITGKSPIDNVIWHPRTASSAALNGRSLAGTIMATTASVIHMIIASHFLSQ